MYLRTHGIKTVPQTSLVHFFAKIGFDLAGVDESRVALLVYDSWAKGMKGWTYDGVPERRWKFPSSAAYLVKVGMLWYGEEEAHRFPPGRAYPNGPEPIRVVSPWEWLVSTVAHEAVHVEQLRKGVAFDVMLDDDRYEAQAEWRAAEVLYEFRKRYGNGWDAARLEWPPMERMA